MKITFHRRGVGLLRLLRGLRLSSIMAKEEEGGGGQLLCELLSQKGSYFSTAKAQI